MVDFLELVDCLFKQVLNLLSQLRRVV